MVGVPGPDDHPQDDSRRPEGQGSVLDDYLGALVARLREALGDELVAVVLHGSVALGAYEPGRSDVDVLVVVERPLAAGPARGAADAVRERALPCPARRLELFAVERAAGRPFEVMVQGDRVTTDPKDEPSFWFTIDRALARERGRALLGPPPSRVVPAPQRREVLAALRDSLDWQGAQGPAGDAVLNAARAWRWARTGRWTSKRRGAEWARGRTSEPAVLDAVLAGRTPDPAQAAAFLAAVRVVLDAASRRQ